ATEPEIENRRAFDEERSLLIEEGLDVAQVHDGRVNLNLTEVGVHGRVEREIGAQADPRIRAESRRKLRAIIERVAGGVRGKSRPARHVRHDLDAARRIDPLDTHEIGEARHESAAVLWRVHEVIELVLARDVAAEVDAPDVLRMPDKSQLRIGNAHFRGPTGRVARDLALPHAIPAVIVPFIIEERTVIQRPGSTHAEIETAALVVIRIDVDLETIGI